MVLLSGCSNSVTPKTTLVPKQKKQELKQTLDVQLIKASRKGDISKIKALINEGANIDFTTKDGNFPLYDFIVEGYNKNNSEKSLQFVKWLIETKGVNYKRNGYNNYSLIHVSQDVKLTEYLISLGLNINALTVNKATTLMGSLASPIIDYENATIQEYLINHCVDLNQTATFGTLNMTTLDFATRFKRTKALDLIKKYSNNPPKQCQNGGILPPKISFYNTPETFDSENANISIKIEAQGFGVGDVILFINGTEISEDKDRALKIKRAGLRVKTFHIKLQNGLNEIKAMAYDQSNTVRSDAILHNVVAEYEVNHEPQLHAIVIGIDSFKDSSLNLNYAEADASLFGTTLFKRSRAIFSKVDITYMKKEEGTTKEAILNKLHSLKNISANDFFVFYAASHGVEVNNKFYLVTSNVMKTDDSTIKKDAISEDELREAIKAIPTANKLILFDTCYSGGINDAISKKLAQSSIKKLNLTSITAANSIQTALEGYADGHGIFTYILSDALDGDADINNDGIVQSMELVNYANKMVPIEAKRFNHVQTPAYFQSGQVFNITKLRGYKGPIDMKPQYFKEKEIKKLVKYMDTNNIQALNKVINTNKKETVKKVIKIKKEAAKIEAKKAEQTLKTADKKFTFGKSSFVFNDNSIFLNIKDKIKKHFNFTDTKGRHLVVFDFYSDKKETRVVQELDTQKVSDIYMADRGDWYRVTLQTKSKQSYEHIINESGIYIKLKNK